MEKDVPIQLEIFDAGWPPHDRFPYNNRMYQVKGQVEADLLSARSPRLITGYASLNTLLDFFVRCSSSDTIAASWLTRFLDQLNRTERLLLSKKKQRALEEMERTLRSYAHDALVQQDTERLEVVQQLLNLFTSTLQEGLSVDWGSLAECWLDVLRPHWYKLLQLPRKRRTRPLLLKDLYPELLANPLSTEQLTRVLQQQLWTKKLDVRVVAAILGVPDERPISPST